MLIDAGETLVDLLRLGKVDAMLRLDHIVSIALIVVRSKPDNNVKK